MMKRIISVFLAAVLLLSVAILPVTADAEETAQTGADAETADTSASYSSNWRQWSQGASEIKGVQEVGCWIVAMSKLLMETGIAEYGLTPDTFYWWERENGWVPDKDDNLLQYDGENAPIAYAEEQGINLEGVTVKWNPSKDDLWSYINSGYYTIIKVNASYNHYVYIDNATSKAQNDIYIMESFFNDTSVGSYTLSSRYGGADVAYVYKYDEYYQYKVLDDGSAEITDYSGSGGDITIPAYRGGYEVTSIGYGAFESCISLTSINIPNSITSIGALSFFGCKKLEYINIPNSVTSIGSTAFHGTKWYDNQPDGLVYAGKVAYSMKGDYPSEVTIRRGTLRIAEGAFYNCTNLTSVKIPDSVTSISGSAFDNCTNLTSVMIGNSVTNFGDDAFRNCSNLKVLSIPESVTSIGRRAFDSCSSLTSITIPDSVKSIESGAFELCSSLTSVTIGNSVTSIGDYAFSWCTSLTNVIIGNSVTSIGERAFYQCLNLKSIAIPESVTSIDNQGIGYYYTESYWTGESHEWIFKSFIIYGFGSSTAEVYAYANELTFVELAVSVDAPTGIKAQAPKDVNVKAESIDLTEKIIHTALLNSNIGKFVSAYNIIMMMYDEIVQPDEYYVMVSIPCDNPDAHVYRKESDDSYTDMNAYFDGEYLTFFTEHFSTYIVGVPKEDEKILLGDADGDGEITSIDVTLIQRHCAQQPINIDKDVLMTADVDGNGMIEIVDATYIQRHLANLAIPNSIG